MGSRADQTDDQAPNGAVDTRLTDWIDDQFDDDAARAAFEAALVEDPTLQREAKELEAVVSMLRALPPTEAPPDFVKAVQSRIRRRTRGRFFGVGMSRYRFPYEAVINGILVALLMALYIIAMPMADMPEITPAMIQQKTAPQNLGTTMLNHYGTVEVDKVVAGGKAVLFKVTMPADRVDALEREIGLYPLYDVIGTPEPAIHPVGHVVVRVLIPTTLD